MNTSKLRNIAWAIFALMLTATTVMGQGWRNGNRSNNNSNGNCVNNISGLTEKQQDQIQKMENEHQTEMVEFRTKRQSTTNAIEKSEIRTDMLKTVEAHRNSVKKVLSDEQQKQYEQLHVNGNRAQNQKYANGGGNRNFQRRGNGNQQFARGNACNSNGNNRGRGGNFQNGNGNRNFQGHGNGNQQFARGNACNSNGNNRGRGGNFQNGNGNRASYGNNGNGSQGRNANYGRGNNRFNSRTNCVEHGRINVDTAGFKVIEEAEFEQ